MFRGTKSKQSKQYLGLHLSWRNSNISIWSRQILLVIAERLKLEGLIGGERDQPDYLDNGTTENYLEEDKTLSLNNVLVSMEGDQKNEDVRLKEKPFILFPMRKGF